jgi:hypothetical protein
MASRSDGALARYRCTFAIFASGYDQWVAAAGDDDDDTIRYDPSPHKRSKRKAKERAQQLSVRQARRLCVIVKANGCMHQLFFFLLVCGFVKGTTRREIGSTYTGYSAGFSV